MKQLDAFVNEIETQGLLVEGVAVADGEDVIAEHRFVPWDRPRPIYSHTKSYTSVAIGMAIDDGLMSLDDKIAALLPEKLPANAPEGVGDITLRHCLTMSSGFGTFFLSEEHRRAGVGVPDYPAYVLSHPLQYPSGARFVYSNGDTHLAARMFVKAAGCSLRNYLYERLFRPAGMPYPMWETDPEGCEFGASGLYLTLTDMMRLGQIMLNGGIWLGVRLIPERYIKEATAKQIETGGDPADTWSRGYGYQFWLSPFDGGASYRADGAYGQITNVLTKSGLVVAVQCPEHGDFRKVRPVLDAFIRSLER